MKSLAVLFALSLSAAATTTALFAADDPTCEDLRGTESQDGKCLCGGEELAKLYEACDGSKIVPQGMLSLTEVAPKGATKAVIGGYEYSLIGNYTVGKFADYSVCAAELGVQRVNDERVMPGGAGQSGDRAGCFARDGACPALSECLKESAEADYTSDLKKSFYKMVYAKDHFGFFRDRSQIKTKKPW